MCNGAGVATGGIRLAEIELDLPYLQMELGKSLGGFDELDDLQQIVKDNLTRRGSELSRAESIVEEETSRFVEWLRSREVIPTVVALRQRFETIRRAELKRLDSKLAGLPPDARARVDEVTRLVVEKLLLSPTEQLKTLGDETMVAVYSEALNRLFSLDSEAAPHNDPGDRS